MLPKIIAYVTVALLALAAALVFGLLVSLPVMWLWNWVIPDLLHLTKLSWSHAFGLMVLCGLLFKSSGSK